MNYKHSCVVDAKFIYKTLVLVLLTQADQGEEQEWKVQNYTLAEGEQLIDTAPPIMRPHAGAAGFVSPKWDSDTSDWIEAATEEEIEAWEAEHPDPNAKTLEELRADKETEISDACNTAIVAGMDVETSQGTEHFALQETDQINLTTALSAVETGAAGYPYHADGQLCRMFTREEIEAIAKASIQHKLYHTTLCNHLLTWARRAETAEELDGITYSADNLPEDLATNMAQVLAAATAMSA